MWSKSRRLDWLVLNLFICAAGGACSAPVEDEPSAAVGEARAPLHDHALECAENLPNGFLDGLWAWSSHFGEWCGPNSSGGPYGFDVPPVHCWDAACRLHDHRYGRVEDSYRSCHSIRDQLHQKVTHCTEFADLELCDGWAQCMAGRNDALASLATASTYANAPTVCRDNPNRYSSWCPYYQVHTCLPCPTIAPLPATSPEDVCAVPSNYTLPQAMGECCSDLLLLPGEPMPAECSDLVTCGIDPGETQVPYYVSTPVAAVVRNAFVRAYVRADGIGQLDAPRLGCPANRNGGAGVHEARGVLIQDFFQNDAALRFEDSEGDTAIIYQPESKDAYLLRSGFWGLYRCLTIDGEGLGGAVVLGAPTGEEAANAFGVVSQSFDRGELSWDGSAVTMTLHAHSAMLAATGDSAFAACPYVPVVVNPPCAGCPVPLGITTSWLPSGVIGQPYQALLAASGGSPPYVWELTAGFLPGGLSLSASGALSGVPTDTGASTLGLRVRDASGSTVERSLQLTIGEPSCHTPTVVNGTLSASTTWTAAGSPYVLGGDVIVPAGMTLTIEAGVVVKAGSDDDLRVDGRLVVAGTEASPVVLTSYRDDTVCGDTNGGGFSPGEASDWGGIHLNYTMIQPTSQLSWLVIRNGGDDDPAYGQNVTGAPLLLDPRLTPVIQHLTLESNRYDGIALEPGTWSGAVSLANVGVPYVMEADVTLASPYTCTLAPGVVLRQHADWSIASGATLSIGAGAVVKLASDDDLRIGGRLIAVGTQTAPVIFTSYRDDTFGGDSNEDGFSSGAASDWGGIHLDHTTVQPPSQLVWVTIRFGGDDDPAYGQNVAGSALLMDPRLTPTIASLTMVSNRDNAIGLETGTWNGQVKLLDFEVPYLIEGDATLASPHVCTLGPGTVLRVHADWSIASGATLALGPGAVVKLGTDDDVRVDGRLLATGTAAEPVVFTSYRDDTSGSDANDDGFSTGASRDWGGIHLNYTAPQLESQLSWVAIRFGGDDDPAYGENVVGHPLLLDPRLAPILSNLELEGNRRDSIGLETGTWSGPVALTYVGVPYVIEGEVTLAAPHTCTLGPGIVLRILADAAIASGATLSIGAGAVLKFSDDDDLRVDGRLVAKGADGAPIVFTSNRDDSSGGDSNGDGYSTGGAGDWGGIHLNYTTAQEPSSLLWVTIRFSGDADPAYGQNVVANPLLLDPRVTPAMSHLALESNRRDAIGLETGTWSGPVTLDYVGVPYVIEGDVTLAAPNTCTLASGVVFSTLADWSIASGATLDLRAGAIVKLGTDDDLWISGRLRAKGTGSDPVVFTSFRDDTVSGDSNGDGFSIGAARDWGGIHLDYTTVQVHSELEWVSIRFSGDTDPAFGLDVVGYPLLIDPRLTPTIVDLTLTSNRLDAIGLETGTWSAPTTLANHGVPYVIEGNVTLAPPNTCTIAPGVVFRALADWSIASGATLAIGPGALFKLGTDDDLRVDGRLVATGTQASPVVFTSYRDDAIGGDTDGAGASSGATRDWGGIHLNFTTPQQASELSWVTIRYSGDTDPAFGQDVVGAPLLFDPRADVAVDHLTLMANRVNAIVLESGAWATDITLVPLGAPYLIEGDVSANAQLTLDPGVIVKFASNADLRVNGRLSSIGTSQAPVEVTAASDDLRGGDSDNNGPTSGVAGLWGGIQLLAGSGGNRLSDTNIRFGGRGGSSALDCALQIDTTSTLVEHVRFVSNEDAVCIGVGASPDLGLGPQASLGLNRFEGHVEAGSNRAVINGSALDVSARGNWWGTTTATSIAGMIFDRADDSARGRVIIDDIATCLPENACSDGNPCTFADACPEGRCVGQAYTCGSPGACETAAGAQCLGDGRCSYPVDVGRTCDDGEACTSSDVCRADRTCQGTAYACTSPGPCRSAVGAQCLGDGSCTYPPNTGAACSDGDACTASDTCDAAGQCTGARYACDRPATCETAVGAACLGNGSCVYAPATGRACDDDDACTTSDVCHGDKICRGTSVVCDAPGPCRTTVGAQCGIDGACHYPVAAAAACSDLDPCTVGDTCTEMGVCVGQAVSCNAPPACHTAEGATCSEGTCSYPIVEGACDDGQPCTSGDTCLPSGHCSGTQYTCDAPGTCEVADGARCLGDGTCEYDADLGAGCSDGDPCTFGDTCQPDKSCTGEAYNCDAPGPCETAYGAICLGDGACTYVPVEGECDDDDACTTGDVCAAGQCVPGPSTACDDADPCTADTCEPATGCRHTLVTAPCDDGLSCTTSDVCGPTGQCRGVVTCPPPGPCESAQGAACAVDGSCTYPATPGVDCSDGDPCTRDDVCQPDKSCVGVAYRCDAPAPCEQAGGAICLGDGGCRYTPIAGACDDDNVCTHDECQPTGCVHAPVAGPCDDGDACTEFDACEGARCTGAARPCDDLDDCTLDECEAGTGTCAHKPIVNCCDNDADCAPAATCETGYCVSRACERCEVAEDCGHEAVCVALPSGSRCLARCGAMTECPEGHRCALDIMDDGGACVPENGDCACVAAWSRACRDDTVIEVDSCGVAGRDVATCARGCAEGSSGATCCAEGTEARDGECRPQPVDEDPSQVEPAVEETIDSAPEIVETEPSAETDTPSEEVSVDELEPEGAPAAESVDPVEDSSDEMPGHGESDSGCAGREPTAPGLAWLLALYAALAARSRVRASTRSPRR